MRNLSRQQAVLDRSIERVVICTGSLGQGGRGVDVVEIEERVAIRCIV